MISYGIVPLSMAKPSTELRALKNLISQAERILSTTALPEGRSKRARELLRAALALADDLVAESKLTPAAAALGHKGGSSTADKYGAEHFRKLAAKRKTHAGGRPRKQAE
jgi:hypothetical protein